MHTFILFNIAVFFSFVLFDSVFDAFGSSFFFSFLLLLFVLVPYHISLVLFILFAFYANKEMENFASHRCRFFDTFVKVVCIYICFPDAYRKRYFRTFYRHVGTSFDTNYDIQRICKCINPPKRVHLLSLLL